MSRFGLCLAFLTFITPGVRAGASRPESEIRALLDSQVAAWNRGDLEAFMATYWNSPKTAYVGSSGVIRGWQSVLDRYRKNYPDRQAMGTVTFSGLEITMLSPDAAVILGHWHLERAGGHMGGVFSLVVRKLPEGWRIILDHTSAMNPPPAD
jgi:uncharacterized protein (TIGR02246 family)